MFTKRNLAAACVLLPVIMSPVPVAADAVKQLGTVTVTGEEVIEPANYEVTTDEVEGITPDAAGLLKDVPGADVNRNGVLTGIAQYRGMFSDRVNVKVNGISVPGAGPNGMDPPLSYIPGVQLDSIQVIRGIAPVSSGHETIGTTMQTAPIRPGYGAGDAMEPTGTMNISGASVNDSYGVGVIAGMSSNRQRLYVAGSKENGGNIEFDGGEISPSEHDRVNYSIGYGLRQADSEYGIEYTRNDTGLTGTPSLPMDIEVIETDIVSGEYTGMVGDNEISARLFYSDGFHTMTNFRLRPTPMMGPRRNTATAEGLGFRLDLGRPMRNGDLLVGIDGQLAEHDSDITNPSAPAFLVVNFNEAERNLLGVFGEWDGPLNDSWDGAFGLRVNRVSMDSGMVSSTAPPHAALVTAFNSADRSVTDTNVDWVAKFNRALSAMTELEIGFARKTRSPSYQERYLWAPLQSTGGLADGNTYVGDINLDPEVSHQVEFALNMQSNGSYFEPRIFYRDVEDYIQGDPNGAGAADLKFTNVDATLYGADAAWGYGIDSNWSVGGVISYVRGRNDTRSDNLYRIAPLNGTLGVSYDTGSWGVTAEGVFYDSQDKVSVVNGESESSGYGLLNLSGRYEVRRNVMLTGGVGNVFDRKYAPHVTGINRAMGSDVAVGERVPGDGRNFFLALRVDW